MEKENRKRILSTAAKLFSCWGFDSVSVQNICNEAGVAKPTLYYYFKSKQILYEQLLDEAMELLERYMLSSTRSDLTFCEHLERMIVETLRFVEDNEDYARFIIRLHSPVKIQEGSPMIYDHPKKRFKYIEEMLKDGIKRKELPPDLDIPVAILSIIGSMSSLVIHTLLKTGIITNKQEIAKRMVNFLFGSIPTGK